MTGERLSSSKVIVSLPFMHLPDDFSLPPLLMLMLMLLCAMPALQRRHAMVIVDSALMRRRVVITRYARRCAVTCREALLARCDMLCRERQHINVMNDKRAMAEVGITEYITVVCHHIPQTGIPATTAVSQRVLH